MQDLENAQNLESATRTCQFPLEGRFIWHVFLVTVMDRELKLSQMYVWGEVTHLVLCCQQDCMFEYRFVEGHLENLLQGTAGVPLTDHYVLKSS